MRRIWNLFGDEKKPSQGTARDEGSEKDGEEENTVDKATQTLSREEIKEPTTPDARTPVRDERSVDEGAKKKSKNRRKKLSRSSEAATPKKSGGSVAKRKRSKEVIKVNRSKEHLRREDERGAGKVVVAEAREIAAKEENEEFENDGGGTMAKSKIKTRDLKWKEESSSEERRKKREATTPVKKIVEAREVNKADDEEFENDGKAPMARSKIKTRDLKWKGAEESPTKTSEDDSQAKKPRRKTSKEKVAEAREVNKADDEEFENDGKGSMARSKIKTRDLNSEQMTEASPGKTSGSDSGGSEQKKPKRVVKPKMVEARDVNKADDEEFENEGGAMARSKIKSRDLKWKKEEPEKPAIAEARELNKEDDEEFENEGKSMARSKIKSRHLKWKKDEEASTPTKSGETSDEARSPIRIVEARDVNKADDEEFENDGKSMARSKITSRDLQWKKEDVSPSKSAPSSTPEKTHPSMGRVQRTPEKRDKETKSMMSPPSADSPDAPTQRSIMQQLVPEKKKEEQPSTERAERSAMLPPSSPVSQDPSQYCVDPTERTQRSVMMAPSSPAPVQSGVRKEVKEVKENVDKSTGARSRHSKNDETSRESADKSFMRRLRPSLNLSRKSKSRTDKSAAREAAKHQEKEREKKEEREKSDSSSQHSQASTPDKSSKERSSLRLDVVASAADKSMKSIKSIFKKSDDTKRKPSELLPHVERDARDVQDARRLMEMLKRNNVFENALFPSQNETLRAHFTSGSRKLDQKTMDLLFKATDFVLDKILFRGEELDEYIDNPLKTFILNRTKSRTMVVELLLKNAEFLPQTWGGRTVVLMRSEEEVTVAPEDEKSKKETRCSKKDEEKK